MRKKKMPASPSPGAPSAAATATLQEVRRRVLVVDDDPLVLVALRRLLMSLDVDVETCSDASRALELVRDQAFDLVISDERMPKVSGLEVLRQVRAGSPRTPTILISGLGSGDLSETAYERCGVFRFVTKPWDNLDLASTCREALRASRALS